MDMTNAELAAWKEQRNKALRELDIEYAKAIAPRASDPEVWLMMLHKARYECKEIEPELRHASRAWLAERNYGRMTGDALLPAGTLPE